MTPRLQMPIYHTRVVQLDPALEEVLERGRTRARMAFQAPFEAETREALRSGHHRIAVPEVIRNGSLVEPENPEALTEGIMRLYRDPELHGSLTSSALRDVEEFEMSRVSMRF